MRTHVLSLAMVAVLLYPFASAQWIRTNGPGSTNVRALAASGTNLFAGTWYGGVFLSTNNGTTWTAVNTGLGDTYEVLSFAVSSTNLFVGMYANGVYLSTNNGTSWAPAGIGLNAFDLAASSTNLFAATYGGVFLSTNNGTAWTAVGLSGLNIEALVVSGANIFAGGTCGGGGVHLSTNNGSSWTPVNANSGLENIIVHSLEVCGTNLFALTDRGVFLTTNSGASWDSVNSGLTDQYINCLSICPNGTGGTSLFAGTLSGVFLSTNNGTNWTEISTGLTNRCVWALAVSGTNVFAGTQDGVWRRSLSEFVTAVESSPRLPTALALVQNYPNPFNPSTTIKYELPTTVEVRLSVYDMLGREFSILVNERKDAGVHEVNFDGSTLASGVYFYRLQAGDFTETKSLVLLK